jgi:mono/diheme cytochrome c family protein
VAADATTPESAKLARGRGLYLQNCARCHGVSGRGDGVDATEFDAAPVDFLGSAVLKRNSDERLALRILKGRRNWLEPYRTRVMPAQTPRTDALERFLLRLPKVNWKPVDAGRRLYRERCASCHGWFDNRKGSVTVRSSGSDGTSGVDDRRFADVQDDADLARLARHERAGLPQLDPPVNDAESMELASFLRLLSPGYPLYNRYCTSCHGAHGRTEWLAFDESYFRKPAQGELRERIWYMLRGLEPSMPHFDETLSRSDIEAILGYLRSLAAGR